MCKTCQVHQPILSENTYFSHIQLATGIYHVKSDKYVKIQTTKTFGLDPWQFISGGLVCGGVEPPHIEFEKGPVIEQFFQHLPLFG